MNEMVRGGIPCPYAALFDFKAHFRPARRHDARRALGCIYGGCLRRVSGKVGVSERPRAAGIAQSKLPS